VRPPRRLPRQRKRRHHAQFNNSLLLDPDVMGTLVTGTDTVKIQGAGTRSGAVTGPGINCTITGGVPGGSCQKDFNVSILSPPVTRTYTAVPRGGHAFAGWSGACSGTAPTCSITGDGTATAKFDPLVGTLPAPPTPPADPGTAPGGGPGIVDAEIVDTWFRRSKRGPRLLKVEILAGEPVHVLGLRPAP
jgi:hypothetical protein